MAVKVSPLIDLDYWISQVGIDTFSNLDNTPNGYENIKPILLKSILKEPSNAD